MPESPADNPRTEPALHVTAADRAEASVVVRSMLKRSLPPTLALVFVVCVGAGALTHALFPAVDSGLGFSLITALVLTAIVSPVSYLVTSTVVLRKAVELRAYTLAREREMLRAASERDLEARLSRGFEMADTEADAIAVVKSGLELILGDRPAEFLLADNSHAHLERMAHTTCDGMEASCPVESPEGCVATRGAHVKLFESSERLTTCPYLRDRGDGEISASCAPVAVMGHTVGVLHSTGPPGEEVDDVTVDRLQILAKEAGGRLGLLRVMAETNLQATTDELTGLLNRRAMEERLRSLRADDRHFALALCEIDGFAHIRDENGTATSEQLLRTLADVLRTTVRPEDIVARRGSEEFLVALPDAALDEMSDVLARVRDSLVTRSRDGTDPVFHMSCGVVESGTGDDLNELLLRAEAALRNAREQGGDRTAISGHAGDGGKPVLVADGIAIGGVT